MPIVLGILIFSWILTSILFVPFIQFLYKWKFRRQAQKTLDVFNNHTPIFDSFHRGKVGTPVGGGILIILVTSILLPIILVLMRYFWVPITSVYPFLQEIKIILFTFLSFGLLGLLDDIKKTFGWKKDKFFGLRLRHKLLLEVILSGIISYWLIFNLKITILYVPLFGVIPIGFLFVPFSMLVIVSFANAFNITDGLDGLASGVLLIALLAFWAISSSILDTPITVFLALWIGSLLAFLYFNVHPARIFLGDTGALSFGATFAVVGILLGKLPVLLIIGGIFVVEVASSLIQLLSKRFLGRKLFAAAPLHLFLQYKGWPETKIVMRAWVVAIGLAIFGLWLALLTRTPSL